MSTARYALIGSKPLVNLAPLMVFGGNVTVLAHAIDGMAVKGDATAVGGNGRRTFLQELKTVGQITLIANERETALLNGLMLQFFFHGDFGTESNTGAGDGMGLYGREAESEE